MLKNKDWKCNECGSINNTGYGNLCRRCYGRNYMRKWNHTQKALEYYDSYISKNKKKNDKRYYDNNLNKIKSKYIAQKNVKLIGLCNRCNKEEAKLRHHPNYDKPKEVLLLCKRCHYEEHKKLFDNRKYLQVVEATQLVTRKREVRKTRRANKGKR